MKQTPKRSFFNRPKASHSSAKRSSMNRNANQSTIATEIVPDSMAVFPMASSSRAPLIDDDDLRESATPKPATPKRQKAAMLLDDGFESPIRQKPTPSRLRIDINEDSPQRPVKKPSSSFLRASGATSTPSSSFLQPGSSSSTSKASRDKHRRSRHLDFFQDVELPTTASSFAASSSMMTPKRQKTAVATPSSHFSSSKTSNSTFPTPNLDSLSLKTPKPRTEAPMTPQKAGTILAAESPPMEAFTSPELFKIDNSQHVEEVVQDSQGFNRSTSIQVSEELDFDDAGAELSSKGSSQTSFNSAEIEFADGPHHPGSDIDEREIEAEGVAVKMEEDGHHSLNLETDDIDFDAEYDAKPIPLKVKGHYNVLALSQLALEPDDGDVLHTVHPEIGGSWGSGWDCVDDASVRAFIAAKRPDLLEEFDSQTDKETKFLSRHISSQSSQPLQYTNAANAELVSSQTGLETVPVMRAAGSYHKNNTRKPIFMTIEDTLNAAYEVTEATSFEDVKNVEMADPEDENTGLSMLDALEDRPAIPDFDPEPVEETCKDTSDPLEDDEELDEAEAKLPTQSYAIRSTDIVDGFRHIQLIGGPTVLCNASRFINISQSLLVTKDTGFSMMHNGEEYLVGPRLAQ
uniref:Spc7 domain-containing protein n=1 Tax=Panagrellus redivivus TaxID=6233 RepID=A0A7E4V3D3_PANRE